MIADEAEIRMMVAAAEDTGVILEEEEEMLYKVFDFADKEVHEVMVPRPEVVAISIDLPPQECLAAIIDSPYTRYPVYRGSLDDVLGLLHVRDLFSALYNDGIDNVAIEGLIRPAHVVPETKDLAAMLAEFRRTNQHMALVIDEYGSFEGIVTLEDLLEEIVGEIEDEYDLPDESVERVDEHHVRIDGTFPIDDFNEEFKADLPQEDYHTVAGFVFGELGRAAEKGDEVLHDGMRFQVLDVDGPRIERLEVEFLPEERQPMRSSWPQSRIPLRAVRPHRRSGGRKARRHALPRVEAPLAHEPGRPPLPGRVALVRARQSRGRVDPHGGACRVPGGKPRGRDGGREDDRGAVRRLRRGSCGVHRSRRRSG